MIGWTKRLWTFQRSCSRGVRFPKLKRHVSFHEISQSPARLHHPQTEVIRLTCDSRNQIRFPALHQFSVGRILLQEGYSPMANSPRKQDFKGWGCLAVRVAGSLLTGGETKQKGNFRPESVREESTWTHFSLWLRVHRSTEMIEEAHLSGPRQMMCSD
jgi:hypothetical protein